MQIMCNLQRLYISCTQDLCRCSIVIICTCYVVESEESLCCAGTSALSRHLTWRPIQTLSQSARAFLPSSSSDRSLCPSSAELYRKFKIKACIRMTLSCCRCCLPSKMIVIAYTKTMASGTVLDVDTCKMRNCLLQTHQHHACAPAGQQL